MIDEQVMPGTEYDYAPETGMGPEPSIVGSEMASPEEEQKLNSVMDAIESAIHGDFRDTVIETIDATPELWQSVSQVATIIVSQAAQQMDEQQIEDDGGIFFGENGAVQQTVELLWEVAEAMDHPMSQDEDQLNAAFMNTLKNLGDMMFEDEDSAREAQAFLMEQETGEDVIGMAADELEMQSAGMGMEEML